MLKRVDHIDLRVADVEASVDFFKKMGMKEVRRTPAPRLSVEVALPGPDQVVFEIRPAEAKDTPGIAHVAFRVENPETLAELKARGLTFDRELNFVKDTGRTVSNLHDPNGNRWQLTD
jgi:catechol 2,3-dioxygenase-like lactoylglutathione lyase family enzyme